MSLHFVICVAASAQAGVPAICCEMEEQLKMRAGWVELYRDDHPLVRTGVRQVLRRAVVLTPATQLRRKVPRRMQYAPPRPM